MGCFSRLMLSYELYNSQQNTIIGSTWSVSALKSLALYPILQYMRRFRVPDIQNSLFTETPT